MFQQPYENKHILKMQFSWFFLYHYEIYTKYVQHKPLKYTNKKAKQICQQLNRFSK